MESGSLPTITYLCDVFREISDMHRRTLLKIILKKKQVSHFKLEPDVYKHRLPEKQNKTKKRREHCFHRETL